MVMMISCAWRTPRRFELWAGFDEPKGWALPGKAVGRPGWPPWTKQSDPSTRKRKDETDGSGERAAGSPAFAPRFTARVVFRTVSVRDRTVLVATAGLSRAFCSRGRRVCFSATRPTRGVRFVQRQDAFEGPLPAGAEASDS